MRYPPAISIQPQGSGVHRLVVTGIAIFIVANYSINTGANGLFSLKNIVLALASGAALAWALVDAWRPPMGTLKFSQGQWLWLQDDQADQASLGTLSLHFDLQAYMLVRFQTQTVPSHLSQTKTQWFHLQARHTDPATWLALRRAVHFPQQSAAAQGVPDEGAV